MKPRGDYALTLARGMSDAYVRAPLRDQRAIIVPRSSHASKLLSSLLSCITTEQDRSLRPIIRSTFIQRRHFPNRQAYQSTYKCIAVGREAQHGGCNLEDTNLLTL